MLATIDLDGETVFDAIKVEDVWTELMLPPELYAARPTTPKQGPKSTLRIRRLPPQTPGNR
jgi:hypothetical protein